MKWSKWLENWDMKSLKIKASFLEMEWKPQNEDKDAAWELYVELLTRITTQPLDPVHGDEKTALDSVFSLFAITRQVLKNHTKDCAEFAKIAIVVLNQVVRPFTAKWHLRSLKGYFDDPVKQKEFRDELSLLQVELRKYTKMLADMAGVEDLTTLEETNEPS
ncbi:hypothetical protein [Candidatus Magnetomonas plexicatena]|uniref:hypothetical protein n=1 Tax=Candidatus Magnetomonas plexicatena TaxID=2552947 RepID=UPI001C7822D7|nr:hypothetical protein E2O03_014530 [Nitrospirales bacterium LBB_01]